MVHPKEIYDLLLDYGKTNTPIKEILIGLTWTLCETESIYWFMYESRYSDPHITLVGNSGK
ncbi:hypothetical protein [Okeania sp. SIO2B3]|uniref:hypothetical protein n=1 Tax=Okeania sp. SIO2B3 TaxID=2607784 RepID=UPI0025D93EF5|nr:hypothetical protein [Okeania sp. SIO2B3]